MPALHCGQCRAKIPDSLFNLARFEPCPTCATPLRVEVFEAFLRSDAPVAPGGRALAEGEASCFNHPQKKAAVACEGCGRFLCALCQVEWKGKHICPTCFAAGKEKGKIQELQNLRFRHEGIAFALATLPILLWPITLVTAPIALFLAIRSFFAPRGLIPRSRLYAVAAILLAAAQITGWILIPLLALDLEGL